MPRLVDIYGRGFILGPSYQSRRCEREQIIKQPQLPARGAFSGRVRLLDCLELDPISSIVVRIHVERHY
jgi:hypothetical protein